MGLAEIAMRLGVERGTVEHVGFAGKPAPAGLDDRRPEVVAVGNDPVVGAPDRPLTVGVSRMPAIVAPAGPRGTERSWRKLVKGSGRGSGRVQDRGPSGWTQAAPTSCLRGALVVACDVYAGRRVIALYKACPVLEAIKAWEMKGPLGKRAADFIGRRLPPGAAGRKALTMEEAANRYEGRCPLCRNPVRMFLAAFASLRDPAIKAFYDRKRAEGKRHNAEGTPRVG